MRTRTIPALLWLAVALAAASPVHALCLDGDGDLDTVCDGVDNCPADWNLDQADADGDLAGDPCDAVDGDVMQPKVSLKVLTPGMRGQAKGYIQTSFDSFVVLTQVTVHMRDGGSTDLPAMWTAADCVSIRGTTRCATVDRSARLTVKPMPRVPGLFRFHARSKQSISASSLPSPGIVELTLGDLTYRGVATLCRVKAGALVCRYPPT